MTDLTIIDGHNYLFRAFYGVPDVAQTKSGIQVNAVYGFFAFLRQIANAYPNNKIFIVFDSETGTQDKLRQRQDYKAGRNINTDIFKQLPYIKQILDLMNIKWLEHKKFEADDIIASLAKSWIKDNGSVYISSNDFDFTQLVSDKINLIRSTQGKLIKCDYCFIKTKFGVLPCQYVDYLSLVGDKTDNIAGVMGVGQKTAAMLLNEYTNIKSIFENLDKISNKTMEKLKNNKDHINSNQKFIKMNTDIPIIELLQNDLPNTQNNIIQQRIGIYINDIGL